MNIVNLLIFPWRIFTRIYNSIQFKRKKVKFEELPIISGKIRLFGKGNIKIGKGVRINSSYASNPIGCGQFTSIYMMRNGTLTIGNNVGMSNISIVCSKEIQIEDNVKIGGGTRIYDTDFHSLDYYKRIQKGEDTPVSKEVCIHEGAFIGAGCFILKGVSIGKHSIVGAGSVVTKNIRDNEIWGGNPAKFIRTIEEDDRTLK